MSVATEHQVSPETNQEPKPSGFTAANGHSPSRNNSADSNVNAASSDDSRSDSGSSTGKRKANNSASSHELSPKRQRLSPSKPHAQLPSHGPPTAEIRTPNGARPGTHGYPENYRHDSVNSETQLAQALTNGMGDQPQIAEPISSSPEQSHRNPGEAYQYGDGMQNHTPQAQTDDGTAQSAQGQSSGTRKRNRTKTGCLTCRERKKKCDEAKPFCDNCKRGGFPCKGYTTTNAGYKPALPPNTLHNLQPQQQQLASAYAPYQYQAPQPMAATYYDQSQRQAIHQPQQDPRAQQMYAAQQHWPGPQPHYPHDPMQRPEYQHVPPHQSLPSQPLNMPDMSRVPMGKPPPPEPIHPPHNRANSQSQPPYGVYPAPSGMSNGRSSMPFNNLQVTAQLASEPTNEKQKMLTGWPFQHRNQELKEERIECQRRVYRFNKDAIDPDQLNDVSRREKLKAILEPNLGKKSSSSHRTMGHLGKNVEVEAPFNCEYGYNINIGDDVDIGPNCRINDSAHVEIGARTIIGPDVKILTLDAEHNEHRIHSGEKRLLKAKPITIGPDVFIGAGAIILAGRTICKGATVGAGTIVFKDVKAPSVTVMTVDHRRTRTLFTDTKAR